MLILTPPETNAATGDVADVNMAMRDLQQRLQSTHRQILFQRIAVGVGALMVAWCIYIAAIAALDWLIELSTALRATGLFTFVAAAIAGAVLAWQRWLSTATLADTAAQAERRLPKFGQRLRTTLDYRLQQPRPATASASLLDSLHRETFKIAERTEWTSAVDRRPLLLVFTAVGALGLTWLLTLVLWPEFRIASGRALLLPLEYSSVTYAPKTQVLRLGESIVITANVIGRPIPSAQLRFRPLVAGAEWTNVNFMPTKPEVTAADAAALNSVNTATENMSAERSKSTRLHGELSVALHELVEDTEFEVLAGPRSLPPGLLRVLQPLKLNKVAVRITPPAYTHRAEAEATSLDLRVLEGSEVNLKLEFNRQPSKVMLQPLVQPSDQLDAQSEAASSDPVEAAISLAIEEQFASAILSDLRQSVSYTLTAQTADGILLDEQQLNIRVQPDLKPRVEFIEPEEELIVTATTEVPMVVDAGDDLGLYKTGILFQIGTGPLQTLIEEDAGGSTDDFRLSALMMLEEHRLSIREAVTYYAYAEDNYFDQVRRTMTPLRYIDIRPYKIKYQVEESNGGAGANDGSSLTLEELISRQRQVLTQSFAATQQSVANEILARIVDSQEEIKMATTEFAAGMAERGAAEPALDEAVKHMDSAIENLNLGQLPDAVAAEQMALAALISARQNLRNLLMQSNSQSARPRRQFDRQQRQKLRMPEKKDTSQQEQLAQTRQELEQLAEREREWSKQAQQCVGSAPSESQSQSQPGSTSSSETLPSDADATDAEHRTPGSEAAETPSPAELAAAQAQLQAELAKLQEQLQQLDAAGPAARNQAGQADASMQKALDELQEENGEAAASEAERAAEQLEQLSDHLAAMNAQDFGQRLEQAQQLAQQLSARQATLDRELSASTNANGELESQVEHDRKSASNKGTAGMARDQQAIAAQTDMLAELLERLQRDAIAESVPVHQRLERARAENPPRDIAAGMRRTADDLQAERSNAARRGVTEAANRLDELTKLLDAARGEFAQPQLKELLALEEQLAQLQEQLQSARGQAAPDAATDQKWQKLESQLDQLAAVDQRMAEALRQLRDGQQGDKPGSPSNTANSSESEPALIPPRPNSQLTPFEFTKPNGQPMPEGFYSWHPLDNSSGMREVSKVLQTKIQEAILAGALLDADQPIPPAYEELVEKYYRALSDDLR